MLAVVFEDFLLRKLNGTVDFCQMKSQFRIELQVLGNIYRNYVVKVKVESPTNHGCDKYVVYVSLNRV